VTIPRSRSRPAPPLVDPLSVSGGAKADAPDVGTVCRGKAPDPLGTVESFCRDHRHPLLSFRQRNRIHGITEGCKPGQRLQGIAERLPETARSAYGFPAYPHGVEPCILNLCIRMTGGLWSLWAKGRAVGKSPDFSTASGPVADRPSSTNPQPFRHRAAQKRGTGRAR
jgi:hypothetical protein